MYATFPAPSKAPVLVGWLLGFYILATLKVMSEQVPNCDSAHSWRLYNVAPMVNQATGIITQYPAQSHYPVTESTSHCLNLLMPSDRPDSDKHNFISHWFDSTENGTSELQRARRTLYRLGHHALC